MNRQQQIEEQQLLIIDGQFIGIILYIASLLISLALIISQRKRAKGEEKFLTPGESQTLALINKILVIAILFLFI